MSVRLAAERIDEKEQEEQSIEDFPSECCLIGIEKLVEGNDWEKKEV